MKEFNYDEINSPNREMEYVPDFKDFIKEHPGVIKSFYEIERQIEKAIEDNTISYDQIFEDGEVKASLITVVFEGLKRPGDHLKVEIDGNAFFVKRTEGYDSNKESRGVGEFRSLEKVKRILNYLDSIEVIEAQLGYQDKNGNTYFVSRWLDLPTIGSLEEKSVREKTIEMSKEDQGRVAEVLNLLHENGFYDVNSENMFFDEETRKIYVYDVFMFNEEPTDEDW